MRKHIRLNAFLVSIICVFNVVAPSMVFAESNTVIISDEKDLEKLSKKCTLDSWSVCKTVVLENDIKLSKKCDFLPIPTFGGNFEGNGYTISGIKLKTTGSHQGFFRYIQESGVVSNLNLEGEILPDGSKNYIGGIAGENNGLIQFCDFEGTVKGESTVGGIVGFNNEKGKIQSCISGGKVDAKTMVGGIAGKNSGFILKAQNNSEVNTVEQKYENNVMNTETDVESVVENIKNSEDDNEGEGIMSGTSDIGGIAGISNGVIQGCINNGTVGYQHVGYNIGGIAGRQSGYMLGCQNNAKVFGRKDVGGIVGQAEPYIILNISENNLASLKDELHKLNSMINNFVDTNDNAMDEISDHLDTISQYSKNASDEAEKLLNEGKDFVNNTIDTINDDITNVNNTVADTFANIANITNSINKFGPVFKDMGESAKLISKSIDQMKEAIDGVEFFRPDLKEPMDELSDALDDLSDGMDYLSTACDKIQKALENLDDAVVIYNKDKVKYAILDLRDSIMLLNEAKRKIETNILNIRSIITDKPDSVKDLTDNVKKLQEYLNNIENALKSAQTALSNMSDALSDLANYMEIDGSALRDAMTDMKSAAKNLKLAMDKINSSIKGINSGINNAYDRLDDYLDDTMSKLNNTKKQLSEAMNTLSSGISGIADLSGDISDILSEISFDEPDFFIKSNDNIKISSENLFDSLSSISDEIDAMKDTTKNQKKKIENDVKSIVEQFDVITFLIFGQVEDMESSTANFSLEDLIEDVSEEDISNTRQGKIMECTNYGEVSADRNIGGIAGAMAIEYAQDPEDDIDKPDSLKFTYRTKAILQKCVNEGKVNGKKDCVGGVVGDGDLGTVYYCENYADVSSSDGKYVGGVAGLGKFSLKKSFSKASIEGKSYVGGIAGKIDSMSSCYAISDVKGDEYIGAVIGETDSNENVKGCYYVDKNVGGIDGISYLGHAEPISYEKLRNADQIPKRFKSFNITFMIDDKAVETKDAEYGAKISDIVYPDISDKDKYYGKWEEPDEKTVTKDMVINAEYVPWVTILESSENNDTGNLAIGIAEGKFKDDTVLHVTENKTLTPVSGGTVYDVTLLGSNLKKSDPLNFRMLNSDKKKAEVWQYSDGKWEKLDTSSRGKYVKMQLGSPKSTICVKYTDAARTMGLIIGISLVAVFLILAFIFRKKIMLFINKKKRA